MSHRLVVFLFLAAFAALLVLFGYRAAQIARGGERATVLSPPTLGVINGAPPVGAPRIGAPRVGAPLTITSLQPPNGRVGYSYSHVFVAWGGYPPYKWSFDDANDQEIEKKYRELPREYKSEKSHGGLPDGFQLYPNGILAGTCVLPKNGGSCQPGDYTFVVRVEDSGIPLIAPGQKTNDYYTFKVTASDGGTLPPKQRTSMLVTISIR